MLPIHKILCPVDPNQPSRQVLRAAGELAHLFGSELIVAHVETPAPAVMAGPEAVVVSPPSVEREIMESSRKTLLEMIDQQELKGLRTKVVVLEGDQALEIMRIAEEERVDLMVLGTHGRTGLDHLLYGSLAEKLVRLAKCPVLVVKTPVSGAATEEGPSHAAEAQKSDIHAFAKAVEEEARDFGAVLDGLKIKLEGMTTQAKARYKAQIEELRTRGEDVQKKLGILKESGGEAWEEVKVGLSQLKDALDRAVSKFKEEKGSSKEKDLSDKENP